jgi:predicted peptidase
MKHILTYLTCLGLVLPVHAEVRTWTSTDGREIKAEFVRGDEKSVTIKRGTKQFTLPLDTITEEDRKYVETRVAEAGKMDLSELGDYAKYAKAEWVKGEHGGLNFQIHSPDAYERDAPIPLVVFLHGVGERGNDNQQQVNGLPKTFASPGNQAKRPCIVVAPQCPGEKYWTNDVVSEQVIKLVKDLSKHMPIDGDRLYLSGYSMGGFGTWAILGQAPKTFAAAVPIAGGGDPAIARSIKAIPIWNFHGDADKSVGVDRSRGIVTALEKVNGKITYTEMKGEGHGIAHKVLKDEKVQEWLFAQKKD